MGRLIYSLSVSLDGFAATSDGGLGWATIDHEIHSWFNEQARTLDASLYGRRMYELMASYWPGAEDDPDASEPEREFSSIWKPMPKVVFSSTLERVEHNARLVSGDVGEVLARLRREFGVISTSPDPRLRVSSSGAGWSTSIGWPSIRSCWGAACPSGPNWMRH